MPLSLRRATVQDAPLLTEVYLSSFSSDAIGSLVFPHSAAVREFWTASIVEEIESPHSHFICVVDTLIPSSTANPPSSNTEKIIAYAKWNDPKASHPDPNDLPKWPEGGDHELGNHFFGTLFRKHNELLGDRKHWYLEILAVMTEHQGRGAGGMLIKWALERADQEGVAVFLEASPAGTPIYKRYGFEGIYTFVVDLKDKECEEDEYVELFMLREPRKALS